MLKSDDLRIVLKVLLLFGSVYFKVWMVMVFSIGDLFLSRV